MNPFVNPKKRSILLPGGCKDLADVLRLPARETGDPIQIFIREMLLQAENVVATEISISGPKIKEGDCTITIRISGVLHHLSTVPGEFRASVVAQLLRMADLADTAFPAHGVATLQLKRRQVKWNLQIESVDADCQLTPFDDTTSAPGDDQ